MMKQLEDIGGGVAEIEVKHIQQATTSEKSFLFGFSPGENRSNLVVIRKYNIVVRGHSNLEKLMDSIQHL